MADVDAEHGHVVAGSAVDGAQHGAVAADRHHEVEPSGELVLVRPRRRARQLGVDRRQPTSWPRVGQPRRQPAWPARSPRPDPRARRARRRPSRAALRRRRSPRRSRRRHRARHPLPSRGRGAGTRRCRRHRAAETMSPMMAAPRSSERVRHLAEHPTPDPGSVITPSPLDASTFAASNCGFTSSTRSAPSAARPSSGVGDRAQGDERQVGHHDAARPRPRRPRVDAADVGPLAGCRPADRRGGARASWSRPTSTATDLRCAPLEQHVGEAAGGRAGVEARRPSTSMAKRSRAASSFSPPRPTNRGGGPLISTGSPRSTRRAALVATAPDTRTRPPSMRLARLFRARRESAPGQLDVETSASGRVECSWRAGRTGVSSTACSPTTCSPSTCFAVDLLERSTSSPRRLLRRRLLGRRLLRGGDFLAVDFFAVDFFAVDFFFAAGAFLAAAFFLAGALFAVDFFAVDFFAADDFLAAGPSGPPSERCPPPPRP